jgi:hypothetical protein
MPVKRLVRNSTIYPEYEYEYGPEEEEEFVERLRSDNILAQMEFWEQYAKKLVAPYCIEVDPDVFSEEVEKDELGRPQRCVFTSWHVPESAEPLAHDAALTLIWIHMLRHALGEKNIDSAARAAFVLGKITERFHVRGFERPAEIGLKNYDSNEQRRQIKHRKRVKERAVVKKLADSLRNSGLSQRNVAGRIARETGLKSETVRSWLK